MAINQLLPFGTAGGANVLDYATYSAGSWRLTGFAAGTAVSQQLNTVWRQGSFAAAMIGQFTADYSGQNVVDDGNVATFETNFVAAIPKAFRTAPLFGLFAPPAATNSVASNASALSTVATYGTVVNGLSTTTFASGILTVGTGEDGYYMLSTWMGTNLPRAGTSSTVNPYAYALTIDLSTDGGSTWASIAGSNLENSGASILGPFTGSSTVRKLAVGNKIRCSAGQNSTQTLNFPVGFAAVFQGK